MTVSVASDTVKPVLSDHLKQDIFLAFQTGGCLLLNDPEFLHYFHAAISNHLSESPEYCIVLYGH